MQPKLRFLHLQERVLASIGCVYSAQSIPRISDRGKGPADEAARNLHVTRTKAGNHYGRGNLKLS
jgi:hypothetical protein